jgi:hypothetical protein
MTSERRPKYVVDCLVGLREEIQDLLQVCVDRCGAVVAMLLYGEGGQGLTAVHSYTDVRSVECYRSGCVFFGAGSASGARCVRYPLIGRGAL